MELIEQDLQQAEEQADDYKDKANDFEKSLEEAKMLVHIV